jgi:hypothetical protein
MLRMQVPSALWPQREEGIEVGSCPGLDVLGRRPGQREIEQHEAQAAAAASGCDADIVRFDVAMGDALFFKVIEGLKEIFPERRIKSREGMSSPRRRSARVRSPAFSIRMAARPETVSVSMTRTMFW